MRRLQRVAAATAAAVFAGVLATGTALAQSPRAATGPATAPSVHAPAATGPASVAATGSPLLPALGFVLLGAASALLSRRTFRGRGTGRR